MKKWTTLSPSAQAGAINLILRKPAWIGSLLDGVESGAINTKDLKPQHWQLLTNNRNRQIAQRAQALEKSTGRAANPDKQKIVEALLPAMMSLKEAREMRVALVTGEQLGGRLKRFDRFAIVLEKDGLELLVYKHAIATIGVAASA